ncbi:hypothetical protein K443DRAFT_594143 [Laccaria amethystina LaAM-08-1]|uniref:Uncharacterized protein n=1 Tax=Laccaria amethystina LaAM-08-1 TaxID=1095629 RepID=A0A0C9XSZ5_9AGAR|nr:hypothetical protein K443DRAFT_594143 [Laccaria amethystina LaAM-08-1]
MSYLTPYPRCLSLEMLIAPFLDIGNLTLRRLTNRFLKEAPRYCQAALPPILIGFLYSGSDIYPLGFFSYCLFDSCFIFEVECSAKKGCAIADQDIQYKSKKKRREPVNRGHVKKIRWRQCRQR